MGLVKIIRSLSAFFNPRRTLIALLSAITLMFMVLLMHSDGFSGGDNTLLHYHYSRWAFQHPEFFLNLDASPVFTLLSAPFAQMGIKGFQFFNILLALASAYIAYLIAKDFKMKSPALAVVICCFTPLYMENAFSGVVEFLFGFIAIFASYLFIKKHYSFASILLSLLPLVRAEGFLFLPIYAIFLAKKHKHKHIALLFVGFIVYGLIGLFAHKNFFWPLTDIQYTSTTEVFGRGRILQYIKRSPGFFGIPNEIFFVTGLVAGISLYFRKKREYVHEFMLVVLPFVLYMLLHSIAWFFGLGNSTGTARYMIAIVPFMAIMATRGLVLFSLMFEIIFKSVTVRKWALAFACVTVIAIPFYNQTLPVEISNSDQAVRTASNWIEHNTYSRPKIFYTSPFFGFSHRLDPFDLDAGQVGLNDPQNPENEIEPDELLVLETYYGKICGLEIDAFVNNPYFELLQVIEPELPTFVFNENYMVMVFRRTIKNDDNIRLNNSKLSQLSAGFTPLLFHDFNQPTDEDFKRLNIETERSSQNKYLRINRHNRYTLRDTLILPSNAAQPVVLQVDMKISHNNPDEYLRYVVEIFRDDEPVAKKIFPVEAPGEYARNQWHRALLRVQLPEIAANQNVKLVTYLWNKRKEGFLIDDYSVSVRLLNE